MQNPSRSRAPIHLLVALITLAGCSSTKVIARDEYQGKERLPRPDRILVYDFSATPDGIPPDSPLASQVELPDPPPTAEELEVGRQLGIAVATELVKDIQEMGLPAARAFDQPPPRPGELVLKGFFLSVEEGSAVKRVLIGFGSGSAELKTFVEGYWMTDHGLQLLGSGEIESGSFGGGPGVIVPIAVTIATANPIGLVVGGVVKAGTEIAGTQKIGASGERTAEEIAKELKPKFVQHGWIED